MYRAALIAVGLTASAMSGAARADPVPITAGAIVFDFEGDSFAFRGPGFELRGALPYDTHIPAAFPGYCYPCRPGVDRLDYSFTTIGGEVFVGSGPALWGGQTYDQVFYRAQIEAVAAAQTFPTTLGVGGSVHQDFVLTASLRAFFDPEFSSLAFSAALRGGGQARTYWFINQDGTAYEQDAGQFVFDFGPSNPVPEPATVMLFGIGLAGLAYRRHKKGDALHRRTTTTDPADV